MHVGLHGLKVTLKVSPMQLNQLLETLGDRVQKKPRMTIYRSKDSKGWEASLATFKRLTVALESNSGILIYLEDRDLRIASDYLDQQQIQEVCLVAQGNWFDRQPESNWLRLLMFANQYAAESISIDAYIDDYNYRRTYTPAQLHKKLRANITARAKAVIEGTQMPLDINSKILDRYLKENDPSEYRSAKDYSFARLSAAGSDFHSVTFNQRQQGKRQPEQMLTCYHKATEQRLAPSDSRYVDYDFVRWEAKLSQDVGRAFVRQLIDQMADGQSFEDVLVEQTRSAILRIIDVRTADGAKRADRWHRLIGGGSKMRVQSKREIEKVESELDRVAEQVERLDIKCLMGKAWRGSQKAFEELRSKSHLLRPQDLEKYQRICLKFGLDQSIDTISDEVVAARRLRLN